MAPSGRGPTVVVATAASEVPEELWADYDPLFRRLGVSEVRHLDIESREQAASEEALDNITALLPGAEAPTIIPLHGRPGQFAVHAVCQESVFWETLQKLKCAGASAILVVPIEKMMM